MAAHRRPPGPGAARRVLSGAGTLALTVVSLAAVAFVLPSAFGFQRYVITGGSMTGTYDKGSVVFERAVPAADLEVGDVITYQPPAASGVTTLVTHRIIRIGHDEQGRQVLRTQGDANPDPDPWRFSLTAEQQPVVEHAVPYVGWALIALADRDTRMLVIGVPAGLIALLSLGQLVAALRTRPDPALGGRVRTA
ncbi:signal peptidase I [Nocardioides nitrophenolicus]|uniref:signal peptidase I n=1 Tax=Nocardioides nitrophenolicus TaxID=60489 RepID=UPI00195748C6|nr:signal peptidase I [Nocardioides nitrophenolicus]MBM7517792.1 signal peptidase [Nocardioides nitrophenolicus]